MKSRRVYGKKRNSSNSLGIIVLGLMIGAGVYLFSSQGFERNAPVIESEDFIYWNRRDPLLINISDDVALKSYHVMLVMGKMKWWLPMR